MTQQRILIVDGDVAFSEILKARLEARGYLVVCARRGNQALDILEDRWIDIVILAVVLEGGMHGFRLFKEIRRKKEFDPIPIIVQSSKPGMRQSFKQLGAEAFLVKPYPLNLMLEKVKIASKKLGLT